MEANKENKIELKRTGLDEIKTIGIPFKRLKIVKKIIVKESSMTSSNGWEIGCLIKILEEESKKGKH